MSCSLPGQVKMLSSIQQELWCLRGARQICFQTCWGFFFPLGNEVQQMQFQTADVRWLKQTGMRHWNIFSSDCRSVLVWLLVCIYINLVCLHWRLEQLPINLLSEQIQHVVLSVSICWAPVVCLCPWSVPSFRHSHCQYLKLSCKPGALEIYNLSWARMSCNLRTLIWHVYGKVLLHLLSVNYSTNLLTEEEGYEHQIIF